MRKHTLLWLALVLLLVGCSSAAPPASPSPVVVPTLPGTPSGPSKEPVADPDPASPEPAPAKRAPVITQEQAFTRVRGIPELIKQRESLQGRLLFGNFSEDDQFYYVSAGENFPERVRYFLHLQVDKVDGTVYVVSITDGGLQRVEPIVVTPESALSRVTDLEAVKTYQQRVGSRYTQGIDDADRNYFGIHIGEQTDQGARWALRYQVDKVDQGILQEVDLAPGHALSHPVTEPEALALVEAVDAAQAIRTKLGQVYSTDVVPEGEDRWLVMLGTAQEGLGWRPTEFFYVERADGRIWNRQRVAY
jgi:hypothetical protein